jgi:release factor glutamine methyltransferase
MNLQTALLQGQRLLDDAQISAPRLTAEVLLAHAIGRERAWLYAHSDEELREVWWIHYGRYLHERTRGKPTQYITGRQEFYGREFRVTPAVLIPRPETEHSVEAALALVEPGVHRSVNAARTSACATSANASILDIGTGSGAIGVTLSLETRAHVVCADISEAAVRVALKNARRLGSSAEFVVCDLGAACASHSFDLIVSNPPYIPDADRESLQREVRDYEPHLALFGGLDGLDIYRRLIPEAARLLKPGGHLILEIGSLAAESVGAMLGEWASVEIKPDLAGIPRVVTATHQ